MRRDQFARDMLTAHNEVRANATPAPNPPLPALAWSNKAAAVAQAWADQCRFEHNKNRGSFGENLAAATLNHWTTAGVVRDWASEVAFYNHSKNTCAQGEVCGHYTQLVWRNTTRVGCATKVCSTNTPFEGSPQWQLWVCNYAPPGNSIGQRPY